MPENINIDLTSKTKETGPSSFAYDQEVAQTLAVDGMDDEGYIKLHSSRKIGHGIIAQHFYKIHADQVNKIVEMAAGYKKTSSVMDELAYIIKDACTDDRITSIFVLRYNGRMLKRLNKKEGNEIEFLASLANECKGYYISKKETIDGVLNIYLDEN